MSLKGIKQLRKEYASKNGFWGESIILGIFAVISGNSYLKHGIFGQEALIYMGVGLCTAAIVHWVWEVRRVSFLLEDDRLSYRARKKPWVSLEFSQIRSVRFYFGDNARLMEIIFHGGSETFFLNPLGRFEEFEADIHEALGDKVKTTGGR